MDGGSLVAEISPMGNTSERATFKASVDRARPLVHEIVERLTDERLAQKK